MANENVSDKLILQLNRLSQKADRNPELPLKGGDGGGNNGGMDVVDAKIAAAEARTDTKFAEVLGEMKAIRTDLSHMPSTWAMIGTMGAFSIGAVGLVLTVLSYAGDRFDGGVAIGQSGAEAKIALDRVLTENVNQTQQIEMLSQQLGEVLQVLSQKPTPQMQDQGGVVPDMQLAPYNKPE